MAAKKETAAPAASSDKKKAIETAMQQIEKMYGCLLYTSDAADE